MSISYKSILSEQLSKNSELMEISLKIDKIIQSDSSDPYNVLGLHIIDQKQPKAIIRTFQPHAESVQLLIEGQKLDMYKMREEGLFELIIPEKLHFGKYDDSFHYSFEATSFDQTTKIYNDPYRYPPLLSDFDTYLFNAGTHYKIYEKLGSHSLSINNVTGTVFRVWAPAARRVSVVGDFNYWDGRVHQMRSIGTSGIWEIFIPGVGQGSNYKYEIRTQNGGVLEKSDPFQFYGEFRPKTASITWDINGFDWHDNKWLKNRAQTKPYDQPMSIYEVHLGSWRRDPNNSYRYLSLREISEPLIGYVKDMGFTHIELMPVMEYPLDESWGYQVTGYYSVSSRYGTPQDLMYFIDSCHQNDIGVILDWVPSHFPTDGHSLGRFDGSALYEHEDPRQGAHPEWGTLIFNYGRNEVRNFLIANALFWFEKFHVDGLRVDAVASMLYLDYARKPGEWVPNQFGSKENLEAIEFLKHLNSIVYDKFQNVLMIAEESTSFYGVSKSADSGGLGFGFKWNMGWMNDTLQYFSKDPFFRKYHHNALSFSLLYAFTENFILPLSHDEVVHGKCSLLSKMPGDKWQQFANLRLLFFFLWTHPGKKLLFMGGEIGQLSEWYCKVSLDWHLVEQDELHRQLQHYVKSLNHFYLMNPALWEIDFSFDGFRWCDINDVDNSIIAYARFGKNPDDHLVCLLNFTSNAIHGYKLGVFSQKPHQEIFCSDAESFGGSGVHNPDMKEVINEPFGQAPYHVVVSVPPLAGIILTPNRVAPQKKVASGRKKNK